MLRSSQDRKQTKSGRWYVESLAPPASPFQVPAPKSSRPLFPRAPPPPPTAHSDSEVLAKHRQEGSGVPPLENHLGAMGSWDHLQGRSCELLSIS